MAVTKRKGRVEQYLPSLVWEQMVVVAEASGGKEDISKGNKNTCLEAAQETITVQGNMHSCTREQWLTFHIHPQHISCAIGGYQGTSPSHSITWYIKYKICPPCGTFSKCLHSSQNMFPSFKCSCLYLPRTPSHTPFDLASETVSKITLQPFHSPHWLPFEFLVSPFSGLEEVLQPFL